jgi:tetratricopeptide (TPR) repeat protein
VRWLLAILLCAAALCAPEDSFEAEFRRGLVALNKNDLLLATQCLERASRLRPDSAPVWIALAHTYIRGKQTKPAADAAAMAEKLAPADPVVQHSLAMFYSETGDFANAAGWERRFASSTAADPGAPARAAELSLRAGDPQQAIVWAKASLAHGDSAEMHHLLGQAYTASNLPDEAFDEFRKGAALAPDTAAFVFDLGQAQLTRGDYAGALITFGAARRRFPDSAQMELAYGVAAYGERRFADAIDSFLHVIRIDPAIEQPYVFLARILDQAGDRMPEIVAAYSAWTKSAPDNYLSWCLHAKVLNTSSPDASGIEAELRRSIGLNPEFWESRYELGILLAKKGQWQEAANELSQSIAFNPTNAAAHFHLAHVYGRLGKPEQARAERAEHERLAAAEAAAGHPTAVSADVPPAAAK